MNTKFTGFLLNVAIAGSCATTISLVQYAGGANAGLAPANAKGHPATAPHPAPTRTQHRIRTLLLIMPRSNMLHNNTPLRSINSNNGNMLPNNMNSNNANNNVLPKNMSSNNANNNNVLPKNISNNTSSRSNAPLKRENNSAKDRSVPLKTGSKSRKGIENLSSSNIRLARKY